MTVEIEFYTIPLKLLIVDYVKEKMKFKNWEIVAIDNERGVVVLKRYTHSR